MKFIYNFIYSTLQSKSKKRLVLFVTFLAFVGAIMMFPTKLVLAKMLPGKSTNTFSIYVDTPTSSSLIQTKQVTDCIVDVLKQEKEITDIETFLGSGSPLDYAGLVKGSTFKQQENLAEIVVNLTNKHTRNEASYMMTHRLRGVINEKCAKIVANTNIKLIEQPAGPPTMSSIVIELYGDNQAHLRKLSKQIESILKQTDGLVDIDTLSDDIYKKLELKINKEKILRSGLSIEDVNKLLYLSFEGQIVAVKNSQDLPEQIPLFLVLSDETKQVQSFSQDELNNKLSSLKMMNKDGLMIPLSELVSIDIVKSTPSVTSKNLKNMVSIIAETDLVSQVYPLLDARDKIKQQLADKYDITSTHLFDYKLVDKQSGDIYELVWDGEMKVTMDTFRDLGGAFISALVLIYLLIVLYYKNHTLSGIVLLGSFLSIIGVIVGHFIVDLLVSGTFFLTATSLIGFISLMGISARNSLLLIDFTKVLIAEKNINKKEAIAIATSTRAKPIFLTAVAIILASALLASDPIFGGLGVALIFGTMSAVVVSLIFIPVLMDNAKILDRENLLKIYKQE